MGETGQTGQSGFELPDRSDRSSAPVKPVYVCCAVVRKVSLAFTSALRPGFSGKDYAYWKVRMRAFLQRMGADQNFFEI